MIDANSCVFFSNSFLLGVLLFVFATPEVLQD